MYHLRGNDMMASLLKINFSKYDGIMVCVIYQTVTEMFAGM